MAEIDNKIGKKIKKLRKSYGLTQIDLAEKVNLSFQQIQKYENGITAIPVFRLEQIADAFGLHVSAFFEEKRQGLKVSGPTTEYDPGKTHPKISQILTQQEIILLKSFRKIRNEKLRQGVLKILKGIIELERGK